MRRHTGSRELLLVLRGKGKWITAAVALSLVGSVLGIAQPLVVRDVLASPDLAVPWVSILVLAGLFIAQAGVVTAARFLLARLGEGVVLGLRLNLVDRLLRLRIPSYDHHRIGDLISRTSTDTMALRTVVAEGITDLVTGTIVLTGTVALMLWLDWRLFLLFAAFVIVAVLLIRSVLGGVRTTSVITQRSLGHLTADLERALGAIRTVRASGAEDRESDRIGDQARAVYRSSVRMAALQSVVAPAIELAVNGSFLFVVLLGGLWVADGSMSVADLVAFLLYMTYVTTPISSVFQSFSTIQEGSGALVRINEALALPTESDERPTDRHAAVVPDRGAGTALLEFRDVWFGYPDRTVLRGTSFQVPTRGSVALIGQSGAGKSTTFALIERFIEPASGQILLHGRDVREFDRTAYRRRIGLVEQHAPLLRGSLRDNLCYAVPDADDAELERVLALVNLTDLVARLPHGLATEVGEHGTMLSGGERQRVAIARALLARPDLLLLDEPTSQLDAENEAALHAAIAQVSTDRALLIIAHRHSTIRSADTIIVLADGTVAADGPHEHLMQTSETYRRLADPAHAAL